MHKPTDLYEACRNKTPEDIVADLDFTSRVQGHQDKPAIAALSRRILELGFTDDERTEAGEAALSTRERAQVLLDVLWVEIVREEAASAEKRVSARVEKINLLAT